MPIKPVSGWSRPIGVLWLSLEKRRKRINQAFIALPGERVCAAPPGLLIHYVYFFFPIIPFKNKKVLTRSHSLITVTP